MHAFYPSMYDDNNNDDNNNDNKAQCCAPKLGPQHKSPKLPPALDLDLDAAEPLCCPQSCNKDTLLASCALFALSASATKKTPSVASLADFFAPLSAGLMPQKLDCGAQNSRKQGQGHIHKGGQ
ncbi:hypothetical protein Pelo_8033 [Pelomyxa schiedti]|nr:hypothetical protein Pelo_8033 [Pelomyxa schiedti]